MKPILLRILALGLAGVGLWLLALSAQKTVTVSADGRTIVLQTYHHQVGEVLAEAEVRLGPADLVQPAANQPVSEAAAIRVQRAVAISLYVDGQWLAWQSQAGQVGNLLAQAGIRLYPGDQVSLDGQAVTPETQLAAGRSYQLLVQPAVEILLHEDGRSRRFVTTAPTLGQALWEQGLKLHNADRLEPPPDTSLRAETVVEVRLARARPVVIQADGLEKSTQTAAASVGEALAEAGLALQGLDYSLPPEDAPLPANGQVRVVRVSEVVLVEHTPIAFENEYQPADDLELDQQQIIQTGEYGLTAQRVRIRLEDGQEVSRQVEGEWTARPPKNRIVGYGTKIVMHTVDTPDGPIQYWRALRMWATSYHPATTGKITASGMPLKKGVAAIDRRYIPFYTRMYIPGYGEAVAADVGGGVIGRWIDLGYSDDDYVSWHQYVTVYFLWPPPDNIVWIIP